MAEIEKNIYFNELFDLYQELLSPHQREIVYLYYGLNLSLGEIAEEKNISRNGVYDALKKGEEALVNFEEKLHLFQKKNEREKKILLLKDKLSPEDFKLVQEALKEE